MLFFALPIGADTPSDLSLRYLPNHPNASEPFQIVLEGIAVRPFMTLEVKGALIAVRYWDAPGGTLPSPPAPFSLGKSTGPLPIGVYAVEVRDHLNDELLTSDELIIVAGGPRLVHIPTLSPTGLAFLAMSVFFLGLLLIRRRSISQHQA